MTKTMFCNNVLYIITKDRPVCVVDVCVCIYIVLMLFLVIIKWVIDFII